MKLRLAVPIVLVFCLAGLARADETEPLALSLTGVTDGSRPHERIAIGLKIANASDHAVVIQRGIEIDQVAEFKWAARMTVEAVADCTQYDNSKSLQAPVRIEADSQLVVTPWHGWTCGAGRQCEEKCDSDLPLGGGVYRFVVVTSEGQRIFSPTFRLPG